MVLRNKIFIFVNGRICGGRIFTKYVIGPDYQYRNLLVYTFYRIFLWFLEYEKCYRSQLLFSHKLIINGQSLSATRFIRYSDNYLSPSPPNQALITYQTWPWLRTRPVVIYCARVYARVYAKVYARVYARVYAWVYAQVYAQVRLCTGLCKGHVHFYYIMQW